MNAMSRRRRLTLSSLAFLIFASNGFSQGERGAITGVVKDVSEAVVPNAEVVALNKNTGGENKAVSTDSGLYRMPYVTPGTYTISATLKGFKTAIRDNVDVRVAQTVTIDFTLELGEISERITVSSETPLLESSTSEIGTETTDKEFHTWPILVKMASGSYRILSSRQCPELRGVHFSARSMAVRLTPTKS